MSFGYKGKYASFEEALSECSGYESDDIVYNVLKKNIDRGFPREQLIQDLDLMLTAGFSTCVGKLRKEVVRVLDIGGQFGGHYWCMRHKFGTDVRFDWDILETPRMAEVARDNFKFDGLRFFGDISECGDQYDIVLSSGSMQNVANPKSFAEEIFNIESSFLLVNRFPILVSESDIGDWLTVQTVPKGYYGETESAYPAWFFSWRDWQNIIFSRFRLIFFWNDNFDGVHRLNDSTVGRMIGFLCQRK